MIVVVEAPESPSSTQHGEYAGQLIICPCDDFELLVMPLAEEASIVEALFEHREVCVVLQAVSIVNTV